MLFSPEMITLHKHLSSLKEETSLRFIKVLLSLRKHLQFVLPCPLYIEQICIKVMCRLTL